MDLENVMRIISDYGLALVISGVFLYLIIRLINILLRELSGRLGHKKHDKELEARNTVSSQIQSLISNCLVATDCDRIQVIEFSNTVMSVAYLPFKYMTCTYEVYRFGEKPASSMIDHISTSLFTPFFDELQSRDYCIFDTEKKEPQMGGAMFDIIKAEGETRILCTMLKHPKGKFIGYLMLMKSEDTFNDDDIDRIQTLGDHVSALLCIMDK